MKKIMFLLISLLLTSCVISDKEPASKIRGMATISTTKWTNGLGAGTTTSIGRIDGYDVKHYRALAKDTYHLKPGTHTFDVYSYYSKGAWDSDTYRGYSHLKARLFGDEYYRVMAETRAEGVVIVLINEDGGIVAHSS